MLLQLRPDQLTHYSYGRGYRYRSFTIRKRRGGTRTIQEPTSGLKAIQQKLAQVFTALYQPSDGVYGFVAGKSIALGAQRHVSSDWVFNADLKDFFPSINFGRVRGLFIVRHGLPANVATVVARLCTYQNELPQGAPTSPIVSNMIARRLDRELLRLARRYRCVYTRYADDLTFSRDGCFPRAIGYWEPDRLPARVSRVGDQLNSALAKNGFEVNPEKVRLSSRDERQIVTGLVVNKKVNVRRSFVRRIRAMLYAWEQHGEPAAEERYFDRYDTKDRAPHAHRSFRRVVKGHIDYLGMIRGTDHRWYVEFICQYQRLVPEYATRPPAKRGPNHLRDWRDAIWVLETDLTQGTAFELDGCGLVTCAHVLRDPKTEDQYPSPHVFSPRNPDRRIPVRSVAYDPGLDLAILTFDAASGQALKPRFAYKEDVNDPIVIAGYPNYGGGTQLSEEAGAINGLYVRFEVPQFTITAAIIEGSSGSPVMDPEKRVVGVATRGVRTHSAAADRATGDRDYATHSYGVVPIRLLYEWQESTGRRMS